MNNSKKRVVIMGAGPAGLTAGLELANSKKFSVDIIEREPVIGGLARTTEYKKCLFDIGPHHYITSSKKVENWWKDLMQKDFLHLKRFTRIFYKKHFFLYPLEPINALLGLSIFESFRCVLSYIKIRLFPIKQAQSLQDWVTNRFGHRLFSIFFKTYSEKLWGISCSRISADWSAQRIKNFSLSQAIFYAFFGKWFKKNAPRTICDEFFYPVNGSGTLWEKVAHNFNTCDDTKIWLQEEIVSIEHDGKKITALCAKKTDAQTSKPQVQKLTTYSGDYFISSMTLKTLVKSMDPLPPTHVIEAANKLFYRGLITINLIVEKANICPDHWLYIHEKNLKMVRLGNMNNFSIKMVNHENKTALSLEYFEWAGQGIWEKTDQELVELGKQELEQIGLAKATDVRDGMIMRIPEAYPVYDMGYQTPLSIVLDYIKQFPNLQLVGRNGMHRYNNMDSAMLSAWEATKNIIEHEAKQTKYKTPPQTTPCHPELVSGSKP
ncbi:MAG: NAD(P)-binding protein [bacterium]